MSGVRCMGWGRLERGSARVRQLETQEKVTDTGWKWQDWQCLDKIRHFSVHHFLP